MKLLEKCPFFECLNRLYPVGHIAKKIIIYKCDSCGYFAYSIDRMSLSKIEKFKEDLPGLVLFNRIINPPELEKLLSG